MGKGLDVDLKLLQPEMDSIPKKNLILLKSVQHEVFGCFKANFSFNGVEIEVRDAMGFAEYVCSRW
jgi:hypothetical protein